MKDKILHKATEMFLNLGFKSVTMDDIANELGVSKKTIYTHFSNKTDLIKEATDSVFEIICAGIDVICSKEENPIDELYEIKRFSMEYLKNEKSSPQHQLQKYYPKIYASLKSKQFDVMQDCVLENLRRGVALGFYRDTIDLGFISRIYFHGMIGLKDIELFPLKQFSLNKIMSFYLEYHLRGICTEKGINKLEEIIINNQSEKNAK
ncbi:TetR/AcrR family transcriptional regulator [Polaribacter uvawellassae]|uniref:TetR/AcrR family transcriptional regulator n=1 Tax=Polaribacter uvawellassae TaxID=3133495 RepID=UPI00321914D4